jgi:hypothetical protein
VEKAQERWCELMEEFRNATTNDSVLAMGMSEIVQLMFDQKASLNLPSLQGCAM